MSRVGRTIASLDGGVVVSTAILAAFGIVMLFSATAPLAMGHTLPPHFLRQLAAACFGLLVCAGAATAPPILWRRLALPFWGACMLLLIATAWAGSEVNGARRWLTLPGLGVTFQPGELVKCATLLAVAAVLADARERGRLSPRRMVPVLGLIALPTGLFLIQPDLGSAVVLVALTGALTFVAGVPLRVFAWPSLVGAASIGLFLGLHEYARRRIVGFIDPWARASDEGFQLVQSFVAFGSGGLFGRGLGDGRQKLFYLPEAHTDFILSVVAEEVGLVGVLAVLGAFAALLVAGLRIASRARNPFELLAAFAMTVLVTVPAILNAAVVMGVVPTKGLTLPFLSYGRTSLVVSCLAIGILLGISRHQPRPRKRRVAKDEARRWWSR
jgi:cell division protein FtsW